MSALQLTTLGRQSQATHILHEARKDSFCKAVPCAQDACQIYYHGMQTVQRAISTVNMQRQIT